MAEEVAKFLITLTGKVDVAKAKKDLKEKIADKELKNQIKDETEN